MLKGLKLFKDPAGFVSHLTGIFVFLLLPVIHSTRTQDPELMPRMLALSVFLAVTSVYLLVKINKKVFVANGGVFIVAIMILIWSGISMLRSVNPGDAFSEWIRLTVLFVLLYNLTVIFTNAPDTRKFICRYALGAVIIFTGVGLYQGITSWQHHNDLGYSLPNSIWSTLSNKNFFSECLVLLIPFLITGMMTGSGYEKFLYILFALISLVFIIILQSAAAWMGLFAGIIFYLSLTAKNNFSRKQIIIGLAAVLMLAALTFYYSTNEKTIPGHKLKSLKEYIMHPELLSQTRAENSNSVFDRLLLWRNSVKMTGEYPVAGAGLNNWKIYNPSFGLSGTQQINMGLMSFEHPHNDYLLIASEQGLTGLLLYLFFIFLILAAGLKNYRSATAESKLWPALICSALIAFIVISFFSYPRSRACQMILLMIFAAMILAENKGKNMSIKILPVLVFCTLLSLTGCFVFYKRFVAEVHYRSMILAQVENNFPRMYREAQLAGGWLTPMDISATPANWYMGMSRFYMGDVQSAKEEYEKALLRHPYHLRILNDLATTYEKTGEREKAISLYKRALNICPDFIEGNLNLCAAYYNSGQTDSAYYYIKKIKGLPMSMYEEKNYNSFLKVIESRRSEIQK